MSAWPGKYVIGLTGNIATGKSVVRKMLEHLGAYGIDADALSHRATAKGAPGFQPVVDYFGQWVLGPDGQIDRARLGRVAFADPAAMKTLESIVHPLVRQAIDVLARRAPQKVVVIEAIKLLEGDLAAYCDSIWVTDASPQVQAARLVKKRKLSPEEAKARIEAQNPQQEKLAQADVILTNDGSFENTWTQVVRAWRELFPSEDSGPVEVVEGKTADLAVQRAGPKQAGEIAELITRLSAGKRTMSRTDVMETFGEKAYMLLLRDQKVVGLIGWQVENLVTRANDFYLEPDVSISDATSSLMAEVERASMQLQSEAALLFLPPEIGNQQDVWEPLGYEKRTIEGLTIRAWQESARDALSDDVVMLFKQLRTDRVLRPI